MAEQLQEAQARCSEAVLERDDLQGQVGGTACVSLGDLHPDNAGGALQQDIIL